VTIPGIKSIRGRLLVLVVLAVVPVFLLGLVIDIVAILREGRKERLAALANAPTHIASEIEHSWNSARSDALFLATIPPVDGIVRAWANNGLDPADGVSTEAFWRGRMAQIFAGLAATKGIYDQIRFLDHNGMEVVRVNFKDGKGIRVPDDQLQNKADRYYFTETAKLPQGQCYVSPADLNRERGQIEVPHKPMLRVATPVSDAAGQFRGMIVLNVLFGRLVEIAVAGHQIPSAETFIADESGYYIYHSASPRKFRFPDLAGK
jgi:methyl-accepting chemotaxis protein